MASYAVHYAQDANAVIGEGGVQRYDLRHNVFCGGGGSIAVLASQYPEHVDCGNCMRRKDFPKSNDSTNGASS